MIIINKVNSVTGVTTEFAVKAVGTVISGRLERQEATVGDFQKFLRIPLDVRNPIEILTVRDDEGHRY